MSLVLVSASPRRAALLRSADLKFVTAPVACDESWRPGEDLHAYSRRVARAKADAALPQHPGHVILAADTSVWITPAGPPLDKPQDHSTAAGHIDALLAAGVHTVATAFVVIDTRTASPAIVEQVVVTRVHMRPFLSAAERTAYLDSNDWHGKAGGYAIQGRASGLVTAIEGSYTAVVGLPLAEVLIVLQSVYTPVDGE